MTRDEMDAQLYRLVALRGMPGDSEGHWEVLRHVSLGDLARGVSLALKNRSWYPAPAELLTDVEMARPRDTWRAERGVGEWRQATTLTIQDGLLKGLSLTIPAGREWKQECSDCGDTGWLPMWCGEPSATRKPWMPLEDCGRTSEHLSHEWVGQCHCWATNTKLIRKRESQAQNARGTAKRGSDAA